VTARWRASEKGLVRAAEKGLVKVVETVLGMVAGKEDV
jgi:hypothetical protein